VNVETESFKISVKRNPQHAQVNLPAASTPVVQASLPSPQVQITPNPEPTSSPTDSSPAPTAKPKDESEYLTIKSPMIGTFYRSADPDSPAFVQVGDEVKEGKVVCIIEAMKLFNEIESELNGTIVKVLVENASPVEYDQPLFLVEPA
ncbi:MAG: acetyl-CoA carboxylase biotin carboxyl carrier protein, partial [Bacteroidota bacterium]